MQQPGCRTIHYPLLWLAMCLLAAFFTPGVQAEGQLTPFTARFELRMNGLPVGEQTLSLTQGEQDTYTLETHSLPNRLASLFKAARRHEISRFRIMDDQLLSLEYRMHQTGGRRDRSAHLAFEWPESRVINEVEGQRWAMPIPADTLDMLNVQIALMRDLAAGSANLVYQIADGGKLKTFRFKVIAEERIKTGLGHLNALKIQRLREDLDRTTYLWCAPDLNYLPIQIRQRESDSRMEYTSRLLVYSQ